MIENGFKFNLIWAALKDGEMPLHYYTGDQNLDFKKENRGGSWQMSFYELFFNHNFAKAFWGDGESYIDNDPPTKGIKLYKVCSGVQSGEPAWKYHLQQMVLEEKPLEYIAKFLV